VGLVPGLIVGGGAGATLTGGSSSGSSLSWLREVMPDLGARLRAAIALPPGGGASAAGAESAALAASVAAIQAAVSSLERALRLQGLAPLRTMLVVAPLLAAGGFVVYRYGWDRLGWVSLHELRLGLGNVKASVEAMVGCLREEICLQILGVRERVDDTALAVRAVSADIGEVKAELRTVGAAVSTMEARMASVETASHRSAEGVELLVRLVASSALSAGASADTAQRLARFGELEELASPAPLELRSYSSYSERSSMPSPPAAPPPPPPRVDARATPGYLRSILQTASN